jgi:antitoxin (DNA-binding transcriptional repressor) of toxin-antitoxin stability system
MMRVNVHLSNDRFPALVNRTMMGERIIIEQDGKAAAAIISYVDLQRFEALEALLKKAELEEYEWLKTAIRNPAFDSLNKSEGDIYTLEDGKPFYDPLFPKTVISNPPYSSPSSITEQEEDIYTINEGKAYHDKG